MSLRNGGRTGIREAWGPLGTHGGLMEWCSQPAAGEPEDTVRRQSQVQGLEEQESGAP